MIPSSVNESIMTALAELHQERDRIDNAIAELEGFLTGLGHANPQLARQHGPMLRLQTNVLPYRKTRSRAGWTPEARQAAAERMRQYWASRRSEQDTHGMHDQGHDDMMDGSGDPMSDDRGSKRSTKGWTDEARQAAADRMRTYWASQRDKDGDHDGMSSGANA